MSEHGLVLRRWMVSDINWTLWKVGRCFKLCLCPPSTVFAEYGDVGCGEFKLAELQSTEMFCFYQINGER